MKIREKRMEEQRMDVTIFHDCPRLNYLHVATEEKARAIWDWLQVEIS